MKTIIYSNSINKKGKITDLVFGILMILIAFSGLFMGSTLVLKLIMYIFPIIILLYSIKPYKVAVYFFRKDFRRFIVFLIQAILLTLSALYILFFPVESLNYIIVFIGILLIINSINNLLLTSSKRLSFIPFLFGSFCILFSNQIINFFYTILLIFILFTGISKIISYSYYNKK